MNFLDRIVAAKRPEIDTLIHRSFPLPTEKVLSFSQALGAGNKPALIAEVKKASPSKGLIRPDFDPLEIARTYQECGAAALSVLTEREFFLGDPAYIPLIGSKVSLPILRKDFIVHEKQIEEARALGASAVLLIVAILDPLKLRDFLVLTNELGMDALVEVHDNAEAEIALSAGARIVGVNNRNLRTFTVDLQTTFEVKKIIPPGVTVVSESGISTREDVLRVADAGIDAVLIGEAFMRSPDIASKVKELFP